MKQLLNSKERSNMRRVKDLILGTMNASKSAQLLMQAFNLERQGKKVLVFKPETDTRDGGVVASRALAEKRPAIVVPKVDNGTMMSLKVWRENPDVIMLDELQFFTVEQVEALAQISITYDVDIYAYGLLNSYTGKMFEPTKRAIECGFRISPITMQCDKCMNDATNHLLYMDGILQVDGDGISVEDFANKNQEYLSVCFDCYQGAIDVHEMAMKEMKDAIKEVEMMKRVQSAEQKITDADIISTTLAKHDYK
ncbi:thymidine kinase [Bacillus phage vB_BanS_Skywalker]|uniref:Thymidine kinase n=2 Tax=Tsamsavirus TaxID=3044849 RepID=A0AAE8YWC7_9CAUD|nr:thymidine kinase [Bacillus phage vB_BanS_Skywalker]UGO51251.1 thymidine kinase [Bacillus phage vB_BanS_Skywalker]